MTARITLLFIALLLLLCHAPAWCQDAPKTVTLAEALALATAQQPALHEAAARTAGAQAAAERSRAPRRLQVRLDSRYSTTSEVPEITLPLIGQTIALGEKTNWINTLGAAQVLFSGGRLEGLARQAAGTANAAEVTRQRIRQQVLFETTRAYYTLLAAQHDREVAAQTLATAQEHLKTAQARLDARAAPRYDVLRAEVQVEEARQDAVRADAGIAVAHAVLLRALGVADGRYVVADVDAPAVSDVPPIEQLLPTAYAQRPELQAIEWQIRAAEGAIQAAKGERRPTVSLAGEYQIASPETPLQLSRWTAALVAGLPILDGGAARARLREAEALRAQYTAARESLRNAIAADVRMASARVQSAREQYTVSQKRLALADETLRIANVRYREGVGTPTEVADAQATLARARQGVTRAGTDWLLAQAEMNYALGKTEY